VGQVKKYSTAANENLSRKYFVTAAGDDFQEVGTFVQRKNITLSPLNPTSSRSRKKVTSLLALNSRRGRCAGNRKRSSTDAENTFFEERTQSHFRTVRTTNGFRTGRNLMAEKPNKEGLSRSHKREDVQNMAKRRMRHNRAKPIRFPNGPQRRTTNYELRTRTNNAYDDSFKCSGNTA